MKYLTIEDLDVAGRTVLVRSDLNVPLEGSDGDRTVADDFRIRAALPTIQGLRDAGATVVVASHLGRPEGRDPALSMQPVAAAMTDLGGFAVDAVSAVVGADVEGRVRAGDPGDVFLLENTRYEDGEKRNAPELSRALADLADLFVNDAFGTAHRAHASNVGVTEHLRSAAGPLLVGEVEAFSTLMESPRLPLVVVLGGAKVSDKLGVIKALLPRVDLMLIGGGMCFTLLAAEGLEIGTSLVEESMIDEVRSLLQSEYGDRIVLPTDLVVADRFAEDAKPVTVDRRAIPDDMMGLDIGPETAERFASSIAEAGSVFWNGPMGVFEFEAFRAGTAAVAEAVGGTSADTVVGGGDSVAALRLLDLAGGVGHVSTGGGAGLELLEGKELPGLAALKKWA